MVIWICVYIGTAVCECAGVCVYLCVCVCVPGRDTKETGKCDEFSGDGAESLWGAAARGARRRPRQQTIKTAKQPRAQRLTGLVSILSCEAKASSRSSPTSGSIVPPPAMRRLASAIAWVRVLRGAAGDKVADCSCNWGAGSPASANICAAEMICPLAVGIPSGSSSQGCSLKFCVRGFDKLMPASCCLGAAARTAPGLEPSCDAMAAATGSNASTVRSCEP